MYYKLITFIGLFSCFLISCKSSDASNRSRLNSAIKVNYLDGNSIAIKNLDDSTFVNIKYFSSKFIFDIKYATADNFLKQKVYDCSECYLRYKTVKKLIDVENDLESIGFRIKFFDCYRPIDIQKKMWELVPNADYVANPSRGSVHNKGCAVDITLVDEEGKELDMGTAFDFFGPESSHNFHNLSEKVIQNRKLLKDVMLKNGFLSFDSEWWHYNLKGGTQEKIANFKWICKD